MKTYIAIVHYSFRMGSYDEWYAIPALSEEEARKLLTEQEGIVHEPHPCYGGVSVEMHEVTELFKITDNDR